MIADAFGLALCAIVGIAKALALQSSELIAVLMGVVTGVAGGVLRDVSRREVPLVFHQEINLYATAALAGAPLLAALRKWIPGFPHAALCGMALTLGLRLGAILCKWQFPVFRTKDAPS